MTGRRTWASDDEREAWQTDAIGDAADALATKADAAHNHDAAYAPASHPAASTTHGVTGAVVGTTDAQTLTNKIIDAALNTLSNIPQASVAGLGAALDALPKGRLTLARSDTNSGTFTAEVAVTGQAVTFTVVAGRKYTVWLHGNVESTVASDHVLLRLRDDNLTGLGRAAEYVTTPTVAGRPAGYTIGFPFAADELPAGSRTLALTAQRINGTGSCMFVASTSNPRVVWVDDDGK